MPESGSNKILGFDFSYSRDCEDWKLCSHKESLEHERFQKLLAHFIGRNELVDLLHIQYTDLMSHCRNKTRMV